MQDAGVYGLLLFLPQAMRIRVGALGELDFPAGSYVYTGRARRGLAARLERHGRRDKPCRWHVDYLRRVAELRQVWRFNVDPAEECGVAAAWAAHPAARGRIRDFGSSDCRCGGHLVYLGEVGVVEPPGVGGVLAAGRV